MSHVVPWFYAIKGLGRRDNCPSRKDLNNHVVQVVATKWKDLGIQLLNNGSAQDHLNIIEADYNKEVRKFLATWL